MNGDDPYAAFLQSYTKEQAVEERPREDVPRAGEYRNIWVWIEHVDGEVYPASLENLGKARQLADELGARCAAVLFGSKVRQAAERLGEYGADRVFLADSDALREFRLTVYRDVLVGIIKDHRPESIIFPATVMGRNLGAQVAASLRTGIVPNCVRLEVDASERRVRHFQTSFEDRLQSDVVIPEVRPQITTITPGSFRRPAPEKGRTCAITNVDPPQPTPAPRTRVLKREAPLDRELLTADAVVVGGLGLGSREAFRTVEELSLLLGGHVGATRASVSCGWTDPRNLITSGRHRLGPRLYVACGVIGEYDHLRAIEESNQIIAISADPTAPICEMADLIAVGEPTVVVREMVETLRKARQERFLVAPGSQTASL